MQRRRLKKLLSVLGIVALGLCMMTGCGVFVGETASVEGTEQSLSEIGEDMIVVGFSQIGSESVWRTANTESIQKALSEENGYFLLFNNARQKQENQIKAIRGFISQRVDYIVFSPVTEDGWETVLQEAKEAKIPVILVDRKISSMGSGYYTTWIGTDTKEEGRKAGLWLEEYLKKQKRDEEEINIVVLQGTIGSSAQLGRSSGFENIAVAHGNWNIIAQKSGEFTTAKGKEVMEEFLQQYQDIDVVVSQNDDMTFGALDAIEEAGFTTGKNGDIIVISFDAVGDALKLVEEGKINVDIECNPDQGEYIVDVIRKLERGEVVENEYLVEEQIFTPENVGKYLDNRTY